MSLKSWPSCLVGALSHIYLELSELTRLARQRAPGSTCLLPKLWAMVPFFPLFIPSFLSVFPSYFLSWLLGISWCLQGKHFTSWLTPMNLTIHFLWLQPVSVPCIKVTGRKEWDDLGICYLGLSNCGYNWKDVICNFLDLENAISFPLCLMRKACILIWAFVAETGWL